MNSTDSLTVNLTFELESIRSRLLTIPSVESNFNWSSSSLTVREPLASSICSNATPMWLVTNYFTNFGLPFDKRALSSSNKPMSKSDAVFRKAYHQAKYAWQKTQRRKAECVWLITKRFGTAPPRILTFGSLLDELFLAFRALWFQETSGWSRVGLSNLDQVHLLQGRAFLEKA